MNSKPYDVVLLPEAPIADEAIALSQKLKEHGVHFALDGREYFPHLSLYMLQLQDSMLSEARKRLGDVARNMRSMPVLANSYHYSHEYIDVEYVRTAELIQAQKMVIEILDPIRDGLREKDQARLATITGPERDNILKYGYRSIGEQFFPHLTFTRFLEPQKKVMDELPPKAMFDGAYPKLALMEMADHGTCCKIVAEWELRQA